MSQDIRTFLFLQGPHGPFFFQLSRMLLAAGHHVLRIGFNAGDEAFWPEQETFIPYQGQSSDWQFSIVTLIAKHRVTDIVIYGDTRPIHAQAVQAAKSANVTVHVFEEGYLRPYWATYERGGSNGNSRLMQLSIADMRQALSNIEIEFPDAPARWGDMRQHIFYGALYHFRLVLGKRRYTNFRSHRNITVAQEFRLYLRRLLMMPFDYAERWYRIRTVLRGGFPIHVALIQLEHDASFRFHSDFTSQTQFIDLIMKGFAQGAPKHHHLVIKGHPLEDGRANITQTIDETTQKYGLQGRVHYIQGGKLAALLGQAKSAVTVNSTAGQQALWRGLPLKAFGRGVYNKREFVSSQSIADFFANPQRPDTRAYRCYRHFLLETSQISGGFYSSRSRHLLLRRVVDMMLAPEDPYDTLSHSAEKTPRPIRAVIQRINV